MPAATLENRQYCAEQVRGVDREKRTIEIIFSDYSLDTYNTRFDQRGWDFERFKKNPVILNCHNDRKFVVAKALTETIRVVGQQSMMTIQFPDEGKHPEADIAFYLYADGFMRGVSIGFQPTKWEDVDESDADGKGIRVRIFRKMRLDEVSLVAIPSNENALAVRCAQTKADPEEIKQRTMQLEEAFSKAPEFVPADDTRTLLQVQSVADVLGMLDPECEAHKELVKLERYFENKQPANRAATKVLAEWFKRLGEDAPAEEAKAWERMGDTLPETVKVEVKEEEQKPVEPAPTATSIPEPEAPVPERKASVLVPLDLLAQLPGLMTEARVMKAVEALQRGKSVKGAMKILDGSPVVLTISR